MTTLSLEEREQSPPHLNGSMEGLAEEIEVFNPNQLMKEGLVVEQLTPPLNVSMEGLAEETTNCQPEVPQREVFPACPD
jgi:hypothetical protein